MISKEKLAHLYYRALPGRRGERGLDSWFFFGRPDDIDWGMLAHRNASEHLAACMEALDREQGGEDVDSPAIAPFCGCETCVVREVLYAGWGTIAQATLAGIIVEYPDL